MTDLTDTQRVDRARRAKLALEEFFYPALAEIEQDFAEKMIATAASTDPRQPEIINRLATGVKMAREVRKLVENYIADGKVAESEIERAKRLGELTPAKRRLLSVAPH